MVPMFYKCTNCGGEIELSQYCKFFRCPYCDAVHEFPGFKYITPDPTDSKYASVKWVTDCPSCRGKYMMLMRHYWRCADCGYKMSRFEKRFGVMWFCDKCDIYLNTQPGFNTKEGTWVCKNCGYKNDVTKNNID